MEILLLLLGIAGLLVGLAGAVLPLPGPPLSYAGMWALQYSGFVNFSQESLITFGVLTFIVFVLDYYVPIWGTKKYGGSKWGMIGAAVGLVVGLFLGPFGMFIGAFAGAFLGEYIYKRSGDVALKAAFGSFLGLMAGIFVKVLLCIAMIVYTVVQFFQTKPVLEIGV